MALRFDQVALARACTELSSRLGSEFLGKDEIIRLMWIAVLAGEHMVIVGPPGTAKSALIEAFARGLDATYFEYLLTRFSEPSELLGPVDIHAFREGRYVRRMEGMLPSAEIVFLDELFKANSAILNSLLHVLNERKVQQGAERVRVPLLSMFAASNEVPRDDALGAVFDRFILRVASENVDSYQFSQLLERGRHIEARRLAQTAPPKPVLSAAVLRSVHASYDELLTLPESFLATYKALVLQLRAEGVAVSDRRAVKLLKLFVASALVDGRDTVNDGDFFVLRHIWNTPEQMPLVREIVDPIVDAFLRENPNAVGARMGVRLPELVAELAAISARLARPEQLSDVQLFAELRQLSELKTAFASVPGESSAQSVATIDRLLESLFAASPLGRV